MSYMWNEFNIKTFPAETIVWRDGVYNAELSTLKNATIDKKLDRPVHIIYVGEIAGENNLNIDISAFNQPVFLSVNIKNKKPAPRINIVKYIYPEYFYKKRREKFRNSRSCDG